MMEFNQPKGIYQQIADQVRDRIAGGEWPAGDRIPSVREMAVNLGVNPNTVTRSYQTLQDKGIIENRRGIGCLDDRSGAGAEIGGHGTDHCSARRREDGQQSLGR